MVKIEQLDGAIEKDKAYAIIDTAELIPIDGKYDRNIKEMRIARCDTARKAQ